MTDPTPEPRRTTCAHCGAPIEQPRIGRPRKYCSDTHAEYAYRERKFERQVQERLSERLFRAYLKGRAEERELSAVDKSPKVEKAPVSPVDESRPAPAAAPATPPAPPVAARPPEQPEQEPTPAPKGAHLVRQGNRFVIVKDQG